MPPRTNQFLVGQHARRTYANRASRFFFTELDKGLSSPFIFLASGIFLSYVAWRVTDHYVRPRQEQLNARRPIQRVPFAESHNLFWGFATPAERAAPRASEGVVGAEEVGSNLYLPQATNEAQEEVLRRPQLLFSEASELHERSSALNPTGEVDVVCLELSEYDQGLRDDVYYRSVHYVSVGADGADAAKTGGASSSNKSEAGTSGGVWRHMMSPLEALMTAGEHSKSAADGSPAAPTAADLDRVTASTDYLQFMPGQGAEVVHGMIKCKGVTTQNNCVPSAGHLEEEYARKLMLTLGPVHILRDAAKTTMPIRFTFVKQTPVETLVLGMHSGELPRWLSTCYPNFHVDVIEKDGTLVRLCKRFLGFQESNNLAVEVADPVEFVRQRATLVNHTKAAAARSTVGGNSQTGTFKPYDLVLIDGMDGAGRLSTQYGRLEFLSHLRSVMSDNGCVAMSVPNKDAGFVFNMVQNWRMAFSGRPVLLIHCVTAPCTILMTFQDTAGRGKSNLGSVASVEEFQDLLRTHVRHYGADRMQFDITREVDARNFSILEPERSYGVEAYLPAGHPAVRAEQAATLQQAMKQQQSWGRRWNAWLHQWTKSGLTAGQRVDFGETR